MSRQLCILKRKNKESIWKNIESIKLSIYVLSGVPCLIYSVCMLVSESNSDIEQPILCIVLAMIIVIVIPALNIIFYIAKKEELEQKLFVLKKLEEDGIKLKDSLEREENYFEKCLDILNEGVDKMYILAKEISNSEYKNINSKHEGRDNEYSRNIIQTIISEKIRRAEALGINISVKYDEGEELYIKPADCVSIIANLLDNAIEAVECQKKGEGKINAYFKADKKEFYCLVENTYREILLMSDGRLITTKDDEENHGIGIINVMETVKHYGKTMNIQAKEGIFKVEIK